MTEPEPPTRVDPSRDPRRRSVRPSLGRAAFAMLAMATFTAATALVARIDGAFEPFASAGLGTSIVTPAPDSTQTTTPPTSGRSACLADTLIGKLRRDHVAARAKPDEKSPLVKMFDRKTVLGAPQVFLVQSEVVGEGGTSWVRALLPIRPNGTQAYIPTAALSLGKTSYRLELVRRRFRLQLFRGCDLLATYRVGIGTGETPTPVGSFYLASLLKLPDPHTIYGPYAYGLSGFSNILKTWAFGGIIGIHGTNDPSSIGRRSSHGCIRMRNRDMKRLVKLLPLGTPIDIR